MARGFSNIRVGLAGAHHHRKRADAACSTGGFYTNPTNGQTLSASNPLNISWDTSCLDTKAVDIYLYAPGTAQSLIHEWQNVQFEPGSYMATLKPQWWNSTSSVDLQLSIVSSGTPVFLSPLPAGPVFNATYSGSPITGVSANSGITNVGATLAKHGLPGGKIAAAVIMPLLLIIALGVGYYLKVSRAKGQEERKRWSEAVDKRMSHVSTDWKPLSAAGANVAVRSSMAYNNGGNRASAFSFGAPRPSSVYTVDGGNAGIGTKGVDAYHHGEMDSAPQMSESQTGSRPTTTTRVSRVSFAADPRPSADRRTIVSRAYHNAFIPPLPSRKDSDEDELSPTQTQGPFSLSQEDINARVTADDLDVMPALSMMRTGSAEGDDFILSRPPPLPTPPTPTHQAPKAAIVMSPDEMLRAYAARKVTSPTSPNARGNVTAAPDDMLRAYAARKIKSPMSSPISGNITYPAPVANYSGNGMRTLYSPTTPGSAPGFAVPMVRDMRNVYAYNEDDDEDPYGGTAI